MLITLGIVEKEYSFGESLNSKKTIYLVKDQLFRFFFRFIEKHKTQNVVMNTDYFYDSIIKEYLDEFVSLEFEKVCRDFLKRKYSLTIEEIGRYWYNDRNLKKDIEIDIMMIENKKLYAFECKWSEKPIGYKTKNNLEKKVAHINDITLGYFSKKGFEEKDELCFDVNDLYNL